VVQDFLNLKNYKCFSSRAMKIEECLLSVDSNLQNTSTEG
jgi:hypothetical protein